jgi:hypothetical protein
MRRRILHSRLLLSRDRSRPRSAASLSRHDAPRPHRTSTSTTRNRQKSSMNQSIKFDYENQAWIVNGRYVRCNHPPSMNCNCYGKLHHRELAERRTTFMSHQIDPDVILWYGDITEAEKVLQLSTPDLFKELEDLEKPTYPEFAVSKIAARTFVTAELRSRGAITW